MCIVLYKKLNSLSFFLSKTFSLNIVKGCEFCRWEITDWQRYRPPLVNWRPYKLLYFVTTC